jgi:predicted DNA-binding transcriptional regulator AlpA
MTKEAKHIQMPAPAPVYTIEDIVTKVQELIVEHPVSAKEAARFIGVEQGSLYRMFRNGQLPAKLMHKINTRHYFFLSEIKNYIQSL